jgi:hypothetical protein
MSKMKNVSAIRELSESEIMSIAGAEGPGGAPSTATGCYYNGQFYSPGSVVQQGTAGNFQCTYSMASQGYVWSFYA